MNSTSRHPAVRARLTAVLAATALGLGAIAAAPAPAFAHEGHDHGTDPVVTDPGGDHGDPPTRHPDPVTPAKTAAPSTGATTSASCSRRTWASRSTSRCSPTSASCTPPATATCASPTPPRGVTRVTNTLDVYANSEDGLQTVALDPDFENNNWVYLVYSPRDADGDGVADTPTGKRAQHAARRRRRVLLGPVGGREPPRALPVDRRPARPLHEQVVLDVEVQRGQCCHVGADIGFDGDGNLYLSTGDNTPASTPAPTASRPTTTPPVQPRLRLASRRRQHQRPPRQDPAHPRRGRRHVHDPRGQPVRPRHRAHPPEIFVMGVRNPFPHRGRHRDQLAVVGRLRPRRDQGRRRHRGPRPMGLVEWNAISLDEPQNAGWPYVHADNQAYNDWDFATATPGAFFDPQNLKNESRWNTGLTDLPPAQPATLWYGDNPGDQPWDELVNFGAGSGQGPMADPSTTTTSRTLDHEAPPSLGRQGVHGRVLAGLHRRLHARLGRLRGHRHRGLPAERRAEHARSAAHARQPHGHGDRARRLDVRARLR